MLKSKAGAMATTGCKKRLFEDVSSIDCASSVHGILTSLSPLKKAKRSERRFFNAELTDGKREIRLVGFHEKQHEQLEQLRNAEPVEIVKCQIKPSQITDELEVLFNDYTQVKKSPSKFSVPDHVLKGEAKQCTIDAIRKGNNNQKVTTVAKVVKVYQPTTVSTGKTKQDTTLADATGTIRFTLWEKDVHSLEEGHSYRLVNVIIRSFKGTNYLSLPPDGATVQPTAEVDTGETDIAEQSILQQPHKRTI